jgi:murein L,D-transpeptidase YafK
MRPVMPKTRFIKVLSLICGVLCLAGTVRADGLLRPVVSQPALKSELPVVNRVVVYKGERRLALMHGKEEVRSFRVSLGLMPEGHKERAGDFRTPEGHYTLTRRNARSDFFLSIQVSYPNDGDMRRARANGWDPGGSIMIHGLPNKLRREPEYYARDWTDGCIAVSNSDMIEIWLLTQYNTPIDILP